MIMVEALVQQLTTARAQSFATGPAPSDLREKLVQTDHTELSQVKTLSHFYSLFFLSCYSAETSFPSTMSVVAPSLFCFL